jgi:hypothetical protein
LKDIEQRVRLDDGKSFEGLYDPTKDVSQNTSKEGWNRYTFRFLQSDGRIVRMTEGNRFFDAMMAVCGKEDRPRKLKITARGKPGDLNRTFEIVEVR